ncbi:MAG: phosphate signaling complex protein PhoU [Phycisphaerae bacterium]
MSPQVQNELRKLREMVAELGESVTQSLLQALDAVERQDLLLADAVIGRDTRIDQFEIDLEKQCQHVLTLLQPVAADLRYVMSALKINADLERIADQSVNIATQVSYLAAAPLASPETADSLQQQGRRVLEMLRNCLAALEQADTELAHEVMASDDEVDRFHRQMHTRVEKAMLSNPAHAGEMICYLKISHELERIADHAVNICEDLLFVTEGAIARHGGKA